MMPRYYINNLGGASKVNMLVGFAPSNYGTNLDGVVNLIADFGALGVATALLSVTCTACAEQIQGSSFLTSLDQAPTVASVRYVVIETADDDVVTPYTNAFLPAAANVQNITLQRPVPAGPQRSHLHPLRLQRAPGHDQRARAGQPRLPAVVRIRRADHRQRLNQDGNGVRPAGHLLGRTPCRRLAGHEYPGAKLDRSRPL